MLEYSSLEAVAPKPHIPLKFIPDWVPDWLASAKERNLIDKARLLLKQWYIIEKEVMPDAPRSLGVAYPEFRGLGILQKISPYEKWVHGLGTALDPVITKERLLRELVVYTEVRNIVDTVLKTHRKRTASASVQNIIPRGLAPPPSPEPEPEPKPVPKENNLLLTVALVGGAGLAFMFWISRFLKPQR